jgi:hypothetical protein
MHDERTCCRPSFGGVDSGDRFEIEGVGAEPINGFSGKGDEASRTEKRGGAGNLSRRERVGHNSF